MPLRGNVTDTRRSTGTPLQLAGQDNNGSRDYDLPEDDVPSDIKWQQEPDVDKLPWSATINVNVADGAAILPIIIFDDTDVEIGDTITWAIDGCVAKTF